MYVFDLDGTLVDSVDAHVRAWIDALAALGVKASEEEVRPLMGLPAAEIARRLAPGKARELAELKIRYFLERHIDEVVPYPDVDVLASLPRPIAVVTSSSGVLARAVLRRADIAVDYVLGGDEVERGKPHPDPLIAVSRVFGVPTSSMVVVGDSVYDVEMALAAGARPICIARSLPPCRPDVRVIKSLRELLNSLR
ncbi:HAD-superfamily hydrolase, subfamily IA, variant 3 [Thermoproteus uzoniensis 768-20]|uniref:HAD-superfamily hydrolase, subfamily IA, variant 3 n=1 Tax=Thermoproteus uzoniensis (strain 768-20) TaxID=999630 RepID=F2L194_THEU7|nr:HAD-IA family hydrolase [Thermoproteus uzoniensis]AEA12830.1 HAD-superfamily hydrolase, subfamily IA, variant 3 [Thermoproteus uzoniensis 768-20]